MEGLTGFHCPDVTISPAITRRAGHHDCKDVEERSRLIIKNTWSELIGLMKFHNGVTASKPDQIRGAGRPPQARQAPSAATIQVPEFRTDRSRVVVNSAPFKLVVIPVQITALAPERIRKENLPSAPGLRRRRVSHSGVTPALEILKQFVGSRWLRSLDRRRGLRFKNV